VISPYPKKARLGRVVRELENNVASCLMNDSLQGNGYFAGPELIRRQSRRSVTAARPGNELCLSLLSMPNVLQRHTFSAQASMRARSNGRMARKSR
jgi:hypothetical protein